MAQTSVVHYFTSRKRPAVGDYPEHRKKCPKLAPPPETKPVCKSDPKNAESHSIDVTEKDNTKVDLNNCKQNKDVQLGEIKKKISRSAKLKELTQSIDRFKKSTKLLEAAEKKTKDILESPKLKTFKNLEFEVLLSPEKTLSPEKSYLSPKKESARRNLLDALSPTKKVPVCRIDTVKEHRITETSVPKSSLLQLPFKYKLLHEIFRAVDTLVQLLYNRKESISFKKIKQAVEEMTKRTFMQKHLAQIKQVYPNAYDFVQENLKKQNSAASQSQWELVLKPNINGETMTAKILLERRTAFYNKLVDLVKDYHQEFLLSLTPPMVISKDNISRWHPEFDIDKVPDIEMGDLPECPSSDKYTTGRELLESAHKLFNCNARMTEALSKLKEASNSTSTSKTENASTSTSLIQGIPKALLEKVRQRQAAKALVSMTRTPCKEKELQMYSRLPEIARLTRNLFVSEKKTVLELDVVVAKLSNSYRSFLTKQEMIDHLEAVSKSVPGWLVFHKLRNSVFIKLVKNADFSAVQDRLEKLATQNSNQ